MDKEQMLSPNLARIMVGHVPQLLKFVDLSKKPTLSYKKDGSPVTSLDVDLSKVLEELCRNHFPQSTFYSEEAFSKWEFPLMVVDPLDGTWEYIAGRDEWVISVAHFMNEKFEGEGWIMNPLRHEIFASAVSKPYVNKPVFYGEVSRSEMDKGLYKNFKSERFKISQMGSIAFKLARLSQHKIDFVVSLKPKNIWDIAGGTLLCKSAGFKFWSEGKEVTTVKQLYQPPLIWCSEELYPELSRIFR